MEIKVLKNVMDRNQNKADEVRSMLAEKKIVMFNMISAPGAGKTTILEKTCEHLKGKYRLGIIEGDIATQRDAIRLQKFGIPIVTINTEGGCHLDSHSIEKALQEFNLDELDLIIVENVGNLVCPSHFDLGENCKVAVVSTTEGDDKPEKYPMLFREAKVVLLNKTDLIPYTDFNRSAFISDLQKLNGSIPLFEISCTKNTGLTGWFEWIDQYPGMTN
jgi:hydrogenase nickel incorporation protein HypB